jgi:exopolysaccharide biosynthesis polyprenyl glycosylphosphotransferase
MTTSVKHETENIVFLLDLVTTIAFFILAFWLRNVILPGHFENAQFISHVFILPLSLALIVMPLSYFGGYESPYKVKHLTTYLWAVARAVLLGGGILLALLFFLEIKYVSRLVITLFIGFEICSLFMIRIWYFYHYKRMVKSGRKALNVLIIGSQKRAVELMKAIKKDYEFGAEVVGFIDPDPSLEGTMVNGIPVIGTLENIHECLKNNVVDEVIIAIARSLLTDAEPIVLACEEGITLRFMADVFNVTVARVSLSDVSGIPLLTMEPVAQDAQVLFAKRLVDITLTLLALPLLLPLFIVVAIAIKLESKGPAIFVQHRVGLRKHLFPLFKFRSMYQDAEERIKDLEHLNEACGPIFKMENDPRVTNVGRLIRKTSIDELPQLINVLRGEMSLVGPRPMSQRDVNLFDKGIQRKRFSVKPGITCIWQVSGRSNLTFDQWLELDLEYIDSWSFGLDIKLLFKTIPAVLWSKGAV